MVELILCATSCAETYSLFTRLTCYNCLSVVQCWVQRDEASERNSTKTSCRTINSFCKVTVQSSLVEAVLSRGEGAQLPPHGMRQTCLAWPGGASMVIITNPQIQDPHLQSWRSSHEGGQDIVWMPNSEFECPTVSLVSYPIDWQN